MSLEYVHFENNTTPDVSKHWLISWIILGYSVLLVIYSVNYRKICIQFIICWQIVCKWAELYANEASCSAAVFPAPAQYFYDLFFLLLILQLFFIPSERQSRRNLKSLTDLAMGKFITNSLLICIKCDNIPEKNYKLWHKNEKSLFQISEKRPVNVYWCQEWY